MKVLITTQSFCKTTNEPMRILKEAGFEVIWIPRATKEQILQNCSDVEVIINGEEPIDKDIIETAKKLKVISHHGVGLDNIDLTLCKSKGIVVRAGIGSNTEAVADHAFMLAMAAARRLDEGQAVTLAGTWQKPVGYAVWGKTMGIIGLGSIGKAVARRARGFNMSVMAYDIYWDDSFADEWDIQKSSLEDIYKNCDFITLHCSLTPENRGLIGLDEMKLMKRNAILVNAARGPLVKHDDLIIAIKEGIIAGAGIDVYDFEPPATDDPLFDLPNVYHTPHQAAYTTDCLANMSMMAVQNALEELKK